jgi:hypothetical protein
MKFELDGIACLTKCPFRKERLGMQINVYSTNCKECKSYGGKKNDNEIICLKEGVSNNLSTQIKTDTKPVESNNFQYTVLALPKCLNRVPSSYQVVLAYAKEDNIIVPIEIPEELAEYHNCDWEGCGSLDHVVRFSIKDKYTTGNLLANIKLSSSPIVCLCGSTKFKKEYIKANTQETLKGNIVLSVGLFNHADDLGLSEENKTMLDKLHLRKIDLADEILVLNVDNYIGSSTRKEIDYATSKGKRIRYLNP